MFTTERENLPPVLDAKMLLKLLPISRSAVYALLNDPGFPTMRIGNRILIPREAMCEWFENQVCIATPQASSGMPQ